MDLPRSGCHLASRCLSWEPDGVRVLSPLAQRLFIFAWMELVENESH